MYPNESSDIKSSFLYKRKNQIVDKRSGCQKEKSIHGTIYLAYSSKDKDEKKKNACEIFISKKERREY